MQNKSRYIARFSGFWRYFGFFTAYIGWIIGCFTDFIYVMIFYFINKYI